MKQTFIKKGSEIQSILKNGRRLSSPFFNIYYVPNEGCASFGALAPKKNFPRAVQRNKAKRRIRAIINEVQVTDISCLIMAKSMMLEADFKDVVLQLQQMLTKAKS